MTDNNRLLLELERQISGSARTIALDRLQASLAASGTVPATGVPVKNDPPRIIVSHTPAILIPLSGQPVVTQACPYAVACDGLYHFAGAPAETPTEPGEPRS